MSRYREISPKSSHLVPVGWKVLQTVLYGATSACGYASAICFGLWLQALDAHCPLFAELLFIPGAENGSLQIDYANSKFGRDSICSFCQFVPILTSVYAFIWAGFFAWCGRGGRSSDGVEPWKLVFAALAFSVLYFPVAVTAAAFTSSGIGELCRSFSATATELSPAEGTVAPVPCADMDDSSLGLPSHSHLVVLQVSSWLSAAGWVVAGLLLLLRYLCLADFELIGDPEQSEHSRICKVEGDSEEKKAD